MKHPFSPVIIAIALVGNLLISGCKSSVTIDIPDNADSITTVDNYIYCVLYDNESEVDYIIKIDPETSRTDTVFDYSGRIEHVKAVDNGIIIQNYYSNWNDISPRSLSMLYTPSDIVIDIIDRCGIVTFSSDHLSTHIYYCNNNKDAEFNYQREYDSVAYQLYYFDLRESTINAKKDEIERYASKHQIYTEKTVTHTDNLQWLDGTWKYQNGRVFINYSSKRIETSMDGEIMYYGSFTIEDNKIIYNRKNGYYSFLDIDYKNHCIADLKNGIRFNKIK